MSRKVDLLGGASVSDCMGWGGAAGDSTGEFQGGDDTMIRSSTPSTKRISSSAISGKSSVGVRDDVPVATGSSPNKSSSSSSLSATNVRLGTFFCSSASCCFRTSSDGKCSCVVISDFSFCGSSSTPPFVGSASATCVFRPSSSSLTSPTASMTPTKSKALMILTLSSTLAATSSALGPPPSAPCRNPSNNSASSRRRAKSVTYNLITSKLPVVSTTATVFRPPFNK